jgi:hypothetical protein
MTSLSDAGVHLGATRTASRPEGPIAPLILMMTTNNDCFPMLLASTLYHGSADSHSGISNGGYAHIVEADRGSIWRKNFFPENRISSSLRPPFAVGVQYCRIFSERLVQRFHSGGCRGFDSVVQLDFQFYIGASGFRIALCTRQRTVAFFRP